MDKKMNVKNWLTSRILSKGMGVGMCALMFFAGCSSVEDEPAPTPATTGVVKTTLSISVPTTYSGAATKMSDAITQAQETPVFRGIQDIVLIPFGKTVTNGTPDPKSGTRIESTDSRIGANVDLPISTANVPTITLANTISTLTTENNSQLYADVELANGTKSFLFYGQATKSTATAPTTDNQLNGALVPEGLDADTPANIKFSLNVINDGTTTEDMAQNLADFLTGIAKLTQWSNLPEDLYTNFKTIKTGSTADIQAAVQDLYTSLNSLGKTGTSAQKTAAGQAKEAIKNLANSGGTTYISSVVKDSVIMYNATLLGEVDNSDPTKAYPGNIYLPDGAAAVYWDATAEEFKVVLNDKAKAPIDLANVSEYVYPPSLYYRANSGILTSTTSKKAYYSGADKKSTWPGVLYEYSTDYTYGTVSATTSSVAIVDQIEYAVARFDVQVKANDDTLEDSKEKSVSLTNGTTNYFPVTGLLIGGQKAVDFEFKPITSEASKTIYDNQAPADMYLLNATPTVTFRTLALETEEQAETDIANGDDAAIQFAIEFRNDSGEDFNGKDGVVPAGCKFYLIGKMQISTVEEANRKNYVYKTIESDRTYKENSSTTKINQVFVQDYVTTLVANVKSLKNAYNVIPDLRTPQLELGLSVDLKWQSANTFNVDIE